MQTLRFLATHPLSTCLLFNGHATPKVGGYQFVTSVSRVQEPRERPWTTLNGAPRVAVAPCDFSRFEDALIPGLSAYYLFQEALSVTTYTLIVSSFKFLQEKL